MGYVDKNLMGKEAVIFQGRLHWNVYIFPVFFAALSMYPLIWALSDNYYYPALALLAVDVILFLHPLMKTKTSEFAVTDKRIIMKVGIFEVKTLEMFLNKVENIGVNQTIPGRVLNYGEVVITGSGGTKEVFGNIARPYQFRKSVQEQISRTG